MSLPISWLDAFLGFGLLIVIAAWLQTFQRTGRAEGTIVRIVSRPGPEGDETSVPEIAFRVDDAEYRFQPTLVLPGESGKRARGRKVSVAYNPDDPSDADVANYYRLFLPPVVATVCYAAFVIYLLTHDKWP